MKEYTKEDLKKIIEKSNTYRSVLLAFGRNCSGSSYKILKKKIDEYNIDISHFLNKSEVAKKLYENGMLFMRSDDEIFCENSKVSRSVLKNRIVKKHILPYRCSECGGDEYWMGKKLSLILDHINGIRNDNRISNLRFLCPNCNATMPTHCRGNVVINKENSGKKQKEKKRKKYNPRYNNRVVNRPKYTDLISEVARFGYKKVGRIYNVSDNTIRKWVNWYIEEEKQ